MRAGKGETKGARVTCGMDLTLSAEAGLTGLFFASFLAATLLPGGSEAIFVALVLAHPQQSAAALALATLGNTLGGLSTYALARLLPEKKVGAGETARQARIHAALRRHGAPLLLLAWAPVIGDALCAAAGWLRLAWLPSLFWMALGKGVRYAALLWLTLQAAG